MVAILIDGVSVNTHRDIVVHAQDGGLQRIFESCFYDPLQYPLILRGELGWRPDAANREGVTHNATTRSVVVSS